MSIFSIFEYYSTVKEILKDARRAFVWWRSPVLEWGFLDCPTSICVHYYLKIKASNSDFEFRVKIKIDRLLLKPSDYKIKVTKICSSVYNDESDLVQSVLVDSDNCKEIEVSIPSNMIFRIVIEGDGGSGYFINNYRIQIVSDGIKVKQKDIRFPH